MALRFGSMLLAAMWAFADTLAAGPRNPLLAGREQRASIQRLAAKAQAIVAGNGCVQRQVGKTIVLALQPRRILKGRLSPWLDRWATMSVIWEAPALPDGLLNCPYALWFLSYDGNDHWYVLPASSRSEHLHEAAVPLPGGELRPEYRAVSREVLIDQLTKELWNGADSGTDELAAEALDALYGLARERPSDQAPSPYAHWAELESAHVSTCPLARAVREWDLTVVDRLEEYIVNGHANWAPGLTALLHLLKDPAVVPTLIRLLEHGAGGTELEQELILALARLRSPEALDALGAVLDRDNLRLQWLGVQSLAHFDSEIRAGRMPGGDVLRLEREPPAVDEEGFRKDPKPVIGTWKSWLQRHQALLRDSTGAAEAQTATAPPLTGDSAVRVASGRRQTLTYRWPVLKGPIGCNAAVIRGREQVSIRMPVSCDAISEKHWIAELEVESQLCTECEALVQVTVQDAWGLRATTETLVYDGAWPRPLRLDRRPRPPRPQ